MGRKSKITQDRVKELFVYDGKQLFWRVNKGTAKAGDSGYVQSTSGYRVFCVDKQIHREHRLIWLLVHGSVPEFLDHVNRDRTDNRLCNLRPATRKENNMNKSTPSNNTSSVMGVSWNKQRNKWQAYITNAGKRIHLGLFADLAHAKNVVETARAKYHKQFSATGL